MKHTTSPTTKAIVMIPHFLVGTLALTIGLHSLQAGTLEEMARVDLSSAGSEPIDFEVVDVSGGANEGEPRMENGRKYYSIHLPATREWKEGSITVKPAQTGRIGITFLGPYIVTNPDTKELKPILIDYDDISIDTAVIKNGGFEKSMPNGSLAYWEPGAIATSNPPLDDTNRATVQKGDAPEGKSFIRVWHNSRFIQSVFVEENVPFTLTFMYRLSE